MAKVKIWRRRDQRRSSVDEVSLPTRQIIDPVQDEKTVLRNYAVKETTGREVRVRKQRKGRKKKGIVMNFKVAVSYLVHVELVEDDGFVDY